MSGARRLAVGLLTTWLLCGGAAAEYRLTVGDVVAFAALGAPTFQQRATIGDDGMISIAPIGRVAAAGLTEAELERNVKDIIATRPVRIGVTPSASELVTIDPQIVTVTLAEYRPVYIDGDVARPGTVGYVPGLTVRQAVAMAGGYTTQVIGLPNPLLASADLRGDYDRLWTEYMTIEARIARIEAEIAGAPMRPFAAQPAVPVAPDELAAIDARERDKMSIRTQEFSGAQEFLTASKAALAEQITILGQQKSREEETAAADLADVTRINDLHERRLVPYERVVDTRRVALLSATRALQVGAELERLREQDLRLARDQVKLGNDQRVALIEELQEASLAASSVRTELQAVRDKLLYTGQLSTELERASSEARYEVRRNSPAGLARIDASDASVLQPGDVVEVTLPTDPVTSTISQ